MHTPTQSAIAPHPSGVVDSDGHVEDETDNNCISLAYFYLSGTHMFHSCDAWSYHCQSSQRIRSNRRLRTFARKFSNIDFFLKILPLKDDELVMSEM